MVQDDIDGVFRWLELESERAMKLFHEASNSSEKAYRINRVHKIQQRSSDWTLKLSSLRLEAVQALRNTRPT